MPIPPLLLILVLQAPPDRVIGLLTLPELFGPDTCVPYAAGSFNAYAAPAPTARQVARIAVTTPMQPHADGGCSGPAVRLVYPDNRSGELQTEEIGYEVPAAIVYERSGNWFRIALDAGSGWIQVEDPGRFTAYPDLVTSDERLSYLTDTWDGRLFRAPEPAAALIELPAAWRRLIGSQISFVRVMETQNRNGELWFRILLTGKEACVDAPEDLPEMEGWIPGYAAGNNRMVWFSSRGC